MKNNLSQWFRQQGSVSFISHPGNAAKTLTGDVPAQFTASSALIKPGDIELCPGAHPKFWNLGVVVFTGRWPSSYVDRPPWLKALRYYKRGARSNNDWLGSSVQEQQRGGAQSEILSLVLMWTVLMVHASFGH